ncbi:MAG: aminoacetone oxidase family FAD-binding enzyme [Oscillospiraceae bacterium]|nr:aminoacetone oxidase family FAD-binding enzyme [Oscillospiraceae bacterium]
MRKRIIIIGGGASGLAAAIAAADCGAEVIILERLPRIGKKILLTGNGKCNLGNAAPARKHYHGSVTNAVKIIQEFDVLQFFRRLGLLTRTDTEGRIYPFSNTAASVADALRFAAEQRHVQILCDKKITGLQYQKNKWIISCEKETFSAEGVILAAGGSSAPNCGTDGNLLPLLKKMGYQIQPPKPALCPILTDTERVKPLKGMRVKANITLFDGKNPLKNEKGEVQFTDHALSGICVFNLARYVTDSKKYSLSLDLLPEVSYPETMALLSELLAVRGKLPVSDFLTGLLPKRVAETLLKQCGIKCTEISHTVIPGHMKEIAHMLHDWQFPIKGTAGFPQSQVTAGGIAGKCIRPSLESALHRHLFFCGELTDVDGDCGGYNLMWAWASGSLAGRNCAKGTDES